MKLTEKDREFLDRLRQLMQAYELSVELKSGRPSYMVLRGTYGERIYRTFSMTRQGVRWRFQRIFNDIYIAAFSTILTVEKHFGTELREHAIRISKERYALRMELESRRLEMKTLLEKRSGLERTKERGRDKHLPFGDRR